MSRTDEQQGLLDRLVVHCREKVDAEAAAQRAVVARMGVLAELASGAGWSQRRVAAEAEAELRAHGFSEAQIADAGVAYAGVRRAVTAGRLAAVAAAS